MSLLFNYFPEDVPADASAPKIARYAYGADYHHVIKDKLFAFMHHIQEQIGAVGGRVFVDSAPRETLEASQRKLFLAQTS